MYKYMYKKESITSYSSFMLWVIIRPDDCLERQTRVTTTLARTLGTKRQ